MFKLRDSALTDGLDPDSGCHPRRDTDLPHRQVSQSLLQRAVAKVGVDGVLAAFPPSQHAALLAYWPVFARPEQLEPDGDWRVWLILAQYVVSARAALVPRPSRMGPVKYLGCHIALVGRTAADVRDVMVRALLTLWRGGVLNQDEVPLPVPGSARALICCCCWRGAMGQGARRIQPRSL